MDKSIRIILFVIVGILVINFIVTILGSSNVRGIRNDLQNAKLSTDSALNELKYSQSKLDSIRSDMIVFQSYISHIQKNVELNDAEKRLEEEKNAGKIDSLKRRIKDLKSDLQTDSLPDIDVSVIKNK